jgi:hypothetical protein
MKINFRNDKHQYAGDGNEAGAPVVMDTEHLVRLPNAGGPAGASSTSLAH